MDYNDQQKRIEGHEPKRIEGHEPKRLERHQEDTGRGPAFVDSAAEPITADVDNTTPAIKWGAFAALGLIVAAIIGLFFIHPQRSLRYHSGMTAQQSPALVLPDVDDQDDAFGNQGTVEFIEVDETLIPAVAPKALNAKVDSRQIASTPAPKLVAVVDPSTKLVYLFDINASQVVNNPKLAKFAEEAKASGKDVNVVAYTDPSGNRAYNQRLSERRANAIVRYLKAHGVPANHINAKGMGVTDKYPTAAQDRCAILSLN